MSDTFKDFDEQFPDDAACLEFIFKARYSMFASLISRAGSTPATEAAKTST